MSMAVLVGAWAAVARSANPAVPAATVAKAAAGPLAAEASRARFTVADDLEVDLVLAEPVVSQPVFIDFDQRGRLWVMQYLQYPEPAGLKLLSKDQWWRAVYDKVPEPPPHGVKGRDRITIHEDTDGDGTFDVHKTFLDGLNIATAFARGRGGVYVLNPPYLLFYADANRDDVPDGDPEVLLEGFGIEDTHSVINSLRWGRDGWLYGAQGSTVTGAVRRPGDDRVVKSIGQNIWRYHPESRTYEIFSEGGGNAFGVEMDDAGRIFSGHNGDNTRGFHYLQGAYLRKGFDKHGELSNPYAFGWFPMMEHGDYARFTHAFVVYESDVFPDRYQGRLFALNPLLNHVIVSRREPVGSTFRTRDEGFAIESSDPWFRPVDIKEGPDGNLYVADWYDGQLAHTDNYQGGIDRDHGRIYRIRKKGEKPGWRPEAADDAALLGRLAGPRRWQRQAALEALADAPRPQLDAPLHERLTRSRGQESLEALWALHVNGGLSTDRLAAAVAHPEPWVRAWAWRLAFDHAGTIPAGLEAALRTAADREDDVDVLCQIACSAKRIGDPAQALPLVRLLLARDAHAEDPRFPLLVWWALEAQVEPAREAVLGLFADAGLWKGTLVEREILPRLMRRFAATGLRVDLAVCTDLLARAPSPAATAALMRGFEEAYRRRSLANVPPELAAALTRAGGGSLALKVRQGDAAARRAALAILTDEQAAPADRADYAAMFGEARSPEALAGLLDVLGRTGDDQVRAAILGALPAYDDPRIPEVVLARYDRFTEDVRAVARALLASRRPWARAFVAAVQSGAITPASVPADTVRQLTMLRDDDLAREVAAIWGPVTGASTEAMQAEFARLRDLLVSRSGGDPYAGKQLYMQSCGKCHVLHNLGGQVGPNLTSFQRDDVVRLLTSIVNPSAEIREGYETHVAMLDDGRVVQGFLVEQDPQVVVLRTAEGTTVPLEVAAIEERAVSGKSLMPEGLLSGLSDDEVRNLFAYLRTTQPVTTPRGK
jgi:putative heme-binding domain-containing protein